MALRDSISELNQLGMDFLHIEVSLAHTFLDSADISQQVERKIQSRQDAETAYKSVLKYMERVRFTDAERVDLEQQMETLRLRLVSAGALG
jgi:hypothetical protein